MTFEKWLERHGGTHDDPVKDLMKVAFDAGWNEGYDEGQEDAQDAGLDCPWPIIKEDGI